MVTHEAPGSESRGPYCIATPGPCAEPSGCEIGSGCEFGSATLPASNLLAQLLRVSFWPVAAELKRAACSHWISEHVFLRTVIISLNGSQIEGLSKQQQKLQVMGT